MQLGGALAALGSYLAVLAALDPNLVLNLATIAVLLGGAWAVYRHGTAAMLRSANADLRVHAEEQEKQMEVLRDDNRHLAQEVELLRQRTDLAPIAASVVMQFEAHETRAQERHFATLRIMDLIAQRLGPETDERSAA